MIKFIFIIISCVVLSTGALWLGKNSGVLTFVIFDYTVETQVVYAVIAISLVTCLLHIILTFLSKIFSLSQVLKQYTENNIKLKKDKLFVSLIENIFKEDESALKNNLKVLKELKLDYIAAIIEAFYCKIAEPSQSYKTSLLALCKYPNLKERSLERLIELSINEEDWLLGSELSEQAYKIKNSFHTIRNYLITNLHAEKYKKLLSFLKQFRLIASLEKETKSRIQAIIYFKIALNELAISNSEEGERYLKYSIDLYPSFTPAIRALFEIKYRSSSYVEAIEVLKDAWRIEPNLHISSMFLKLRPHFSSEDYYKIIRKTVSYSPEHYESNLLLCEAALTCGQYDIASNEVSKILEAPCRKRATLLMAKFCLMTHANVAEVLEWLKQSSDEPDEEIKDEYYIDYDTLKISLFKPIKGCLVAKIKM